MEPVYYYCPECPGLWDNQTSLISPKGITCPDCGCLLHTDYLMASEIEDEDALTCDDICIRDVLCSICQDMDRDGYYSGLIDDELFSVIIRWVEEDRPCVSDSNRDALWTAIYSYPCEFKTIEDVICRLDSILGLESRVN